MARIDKFIDALFKRGADRVLFVSGEKVALVFGSDLRPVTASSLHMKSLKSFVEEIVPTNLAAEVGQEGQHRFAYASPSGSVWVEVTQKADAIRVEVTARDEASEGASIPEAVSFLTF